MRWQIKLFLDFFYKKVSRIVKKLLILSCFIILFSQVVMTSGCSIAEEYPAKLLLSYLPLNLQNQKNAPLPEGCAQGTLVKTQDGYVPIEVLVSGDVIEGKDGGSKLFVFKKIMDRVV